MTMLGETQDERLYREIDETFDDKDAAETKRKGLESHGGNFTVTEIEVDVPE